MAPAASFASLPSCLSFFYPYHRGSNYFLYLFFLPASLSLFLSSLFFLLLSRGSLHLSGSRKGEIEGTIRELLPDSSFFFFFFSLELFFLLLFLRLDLTRFARKPVTGYA